MSLVIKNRGERKKHIIDSLKTPQTVCGVPVKSGAEIFDEVEQGKLNLCEKCYAWIGKQMAYEYFGADFFVESISKHKKRSP